MIPDQEHGLSALALSDDDIAALSYEKAIQLLEQVVDALETEETPLEQGIALYELGMRLSRRCGTLLDATEARMRKVIEQQGQQPATVDFDLDKEGR